MSFPIDQLHRILFIDIETANSVNGFEMLDDKISQLWKGKMKSSNQLKGKPPHVSDPASLYQSKGAIFSEFARIVCISLGYIYESNQGYSFKIKSFYGDDEIKVLSSFIQLLNSYYYDRHNQFLCGHNIKEFDIPFICRRSIIHGFKLPNLLNIAGYKPWQVHHLIDTMEMWKFGDYKHYTSLELLCHCLKIKTPKDAMSGNEVSGAFWEGRMAEIVNYCQKDVVATAQVYLKLLGLPCINESSIIIEEEMIDFAL